jgi:hypothetical protein
MSGQGGVPYGGTILDMRYSGSDAKIVTLGLGLLEMTGLTLYDPSGSSTPFLITTNTTLLVYGNAFIGSKSGTACDQDCLILGGTTQTHTPATTASPFQGYGTVIERNYFNKIRRAAYLRVYANGVIIRDNCIWNQCGTGIANGAAIEIDGGPSADVGNVITGNLIELPGYPFGVLLGTNAVNNTVAWNNMFDESATTVGSVRIVSGAEYNLVIDGIRNDTKVGMSDENALDVNTFITGHQAQISVVPQPQQFQNVNVQAPGIPTFKLTNTNTPNVIAMENGGSLSYPSLGFHFAVNGAASSMIATLYRAGADATAQLLLNGNARLSAGGSLKLQSTGGSEVYLGDTSTGSLYWSEGGKVLVLNNASAYIAMGNASTGPRILQGTGAPSMAAPKGSLYLRTDGGAGTCLYVNESGSTTWVAK